MKRQSGNYHPTLNRKKKLYIRHYKINKELWKWRLAFDKNRRKQDKSF